MPVTSTTPLMNLVLPTVGPTGQVGPTWATNLNDAFNLVDAHDHTTGKGPKVPVAGLSINADLSIGGFNLTNVNTTKYNSLGSALASSFTNSVYVVGGELYFNDGSGTDVQLTSGGAINVASLGTITGDYSTSTADLNYSDTTKTFTFKQSATETAFISCGSISIFENVASAKFTRIQNTTSQASDQTITLWAALPGSTLPVKLSAAGVLSSATIDTADITNLAVTAGKIANTTITQTQMANASIGTAQLIDANVTQAKRAALGQQISSAVTFQQTTSTSPVDITNLSVSITTTGRPVYIGFIPDGSTSNSAIGGNRVSVSGVMHSEYYIVRDSTTIAEIEWFFNATATLAGATTPPGCIWIIDTPAAGTYTYKAQMSLGSGGSGARATINAVKLIAYEL